MTSKVKSSLLDAQSYINAVSGSLSSPQATLSGFWKLDQALTGSLHGNADTASTLLTTYNLNGTGFNGSQNITVPLNTTTTNSNGTYYPTFVSSNSSANQTAYVNGSLYYNASNGQLNVSSLVASGTISGSNISFNNGGVLTPQQTLGTYQGVGAQTSVGLVFGHASPGGTPTGATYIEIGNTATADGSNAQLWVKSDTSQIQVLSQASGNSSAAGGGSAGLYGNSTNGMFLWENTGSIIKFVIGGNLTTPQMTIDNNGNVVVSGNITAYSDITLKDNIVNIKNALNKVTQIRGVTYTRKDLADTQTRYTGVIAQEIETVLPEAVMTDADGIKSVAYGNTVGLLIEAIKELNSKVDSLQKQLDEKNNDTTND